MVSRLLLAACALTACMLAAGACRRGDASPEPPLHPYAVVAAYPHDPDAFTQGLFFHDGLLYESTGGHGRSTLRRVRPADGRVLRAIPFPDGVFGEGITQVGEEIVGLSWREGRGFRWDRDSFALRGRFGYEGEGWGIAFDGRRLVMSDGTDRLRFLDPGTLRAAGHVRVTAAGRPVARLNELEWMGGCLLANIWGSPRIARIDPKTGAVASWIDLTPLLPKSGADSPEAVANGIAYDAAGSRLFVTGKNWRRLFVLRPDPSAKAGGC